MSVSPTMATSVCWCYRPLDVRRPEVPCRRATTGVLMDVRHLRAFIAVLDEGGFAAAALRLRVSKATVSERIAHLEVEVGDRLLERHPLGLTAAGAAFQEHARRMLLEADSALAAVGAVGRPRANVLRIGHLTSGAADYNVPIYEGLRRALPGVRIQTVELSLSGADAAVVHGLVDVAFLRDPVEDPRLEVVPLYSTGRVAALSSTNPLASRATLRVADLDKMPVTAVHHGQNHATWLRYAMVDERNGETPMVLESSTFPEVLLNVLVRGAVAAPSAGSARWLTVPGIHFVPLTDALPSGPIAVGRRSDRRPAVRAFLELSAWVAATCQSLVPDRVRPSA